MSEREPLSNVKFVCPDGIFTSAQVLVDGQPLIGVRSAVYRMEPESIGVLTLELEGVSVDVDAATVKVVGLEAEPRAICPECRNGKHMNCGPALNEQTDEVVPCECEYDS